jgi:hypothetical protein
MSSKHKEVNSESGFENSYLIQNGRIFKYGIVMILSNSVLETTVVGGLECFSEKLLKYSLQQKHYAKMVGRNIEVFTRKGDKKVAAIPKKEFRFIHLDPEEVIVAEKGFVIGEHSKRVLPSLLMALKGKKPSCFDNSTYLRVSAKRAGQKLIEYIFEDGKSLLLTKEGKVVRHTEDTFLSYERWGEPVPIRKHESHRIEPVSSDF